MKVRLTYSFTKNLVTVKQGKKLKLLKILKVKA